MYKPFNSKKHFLALVTKCCEVRIKLLTRNEKTGVTDWWVKVSKNEIRLLINKKEMIGTPLSRIKYNLHTHLVPKGGVLYIQAKHKN